MTPGWKASLVGRRWSLLDLSPGSCLPVIHHIISTHLGPLRAGSKENKWGLPVVVLTLLHKWKRSVARQWPGPGRGSMGASASKEGFLEEVTHASHPSSTGSFPGALTGFLALPTGSRRFQRMGMPSFPPPPSPQLQLQSGHLGS